MTDDSRPSAMRSTTFGPDGAPRVSGISWLLAGGGGLIGVALLAAAISLWWRHGSAVFFDLIASGIAYCF